MTLRSNSECLAMYRRLERSIVASLGLFGLQQFERALDIFKIAVGVGVI